MLNSHKTLPSINGGPNSNWNVFAAERVLDPIKRKPLIFVAYSQVSWEAVPLHRLRGNPELCFKTRTYHTFLWCLINSLPKMQLSPKRASSIIANNDTGVTRKREHISFFCKWIRPIPSHISQLTVHALKNTNKLLIDSENTFDTSVSFSERNRLCSYV
jgi:hypothetical protein